MDVVEVEEILGLFRFAKPQHVILIKEPVVERLDGATVYYRGLQPRGRGDVIVLTAHAIDETIIHEALHALGLGELGATVLAKVLVRKARALESLPTLKALVQRDVKYEKCSWCQEFPRAHQYGARVEHYVKVK